MRRWLPILICLGLAAMAAVALAQVESAPRARAAMIAATGSFEISDSGEGQPIFSATGIGPGEPARGTVEIEDTGSEPVALHLRQGELVDVPGLGGAALSERLQLTVVDVTEPAAPRTIYAGPLASMPEQAAGNLEGGETRSFRFTATLPGGGAPSVVNAVQGASTTVAYSWIASEPEEESEQEKGGEERPDEAGGGEQPRTPGAPGSGGPVTHYESEVSAARASFDLIVPKIRRRLRGGRLTAWFDCDQSCRLYVRGRVQATAAGTRRRVEFRFAESRFYSPGPQLLRIPVPRALRRWMRTAVGREHLRAKLRFIAVDPEGGRAVVRKTAKLRAR